MKFALLTSDRSITPVLRALLSCSDHEVISGWTNNESLKREIQSEVSTIQLAAGWDELLENKSIEAVILAGFDEPLLTAASQLLNQGKRILVVVPTVGDVTRVFDCTPLWQEAGDRIVPLFLSGVEAAAQGLQQQFAEDQLGRLWKIDFQRNLDRSQHESLTQEKARAWFLHDCAWMRKLNPAANQVMMTTTGPSENTISEVNIRLTGPDAIEATWSLQADENSQCELTFTGEKGELAATFNSGLSPEVRAPYVIHADVGADWQNADLRDQIDQFAAGEPGHDWTDLIKIGEFGAVADRSLLKRRTLPVHFEEASERSQFKSQMAAIGCGALLWTMFGMIAMLAVAAVADPRDREYLTSLSADFVIKNDEFMDGSDELTSVGYQHLGRITESWSSTSPIVIVEAEPELPELNDQRQAKVISELEVAEVKDAKQRVIARPIKGQWFETAMILGWTVVFLPVGVVLVAQLLLLVARPIEN